jgi:predicted glycoside hydrolase/deacetylase ChbG (UPF0249 family)
VKELIVNADDFGHSDAVNEGVIEAHERGILTSASLLVRRTAAGAAAAYARTRRSLGVGLHVELGEWVFSEDRGWSAVHEVPVEDVEAEIDRQLTTFEQLVGRRPTHLDSHQHVHRRSPGREVLLARAASLRVPLRHFCAQVRYCGGFYGQDDEGRPYPQAITADALAVLIRDLPHGVTELCCHPGKGRIAGSTYAAERERELAALCSDVVGGAVTAAGVRLRTFEGLA